MTVVYKDIGQLTKKQSVSGAEKIEVSDTEFITPDQIVSNLYGIESLDSLTVYKNVINPDGSWAGASATQAESVVLPITPGETYLVKFVSAGIIAVIEDTTPKSSGAVSFADGYTERMVQSAGDEFQFTAPSDAASLYFLMKSTTGTVYTYKVYHLKKMIGGALRYVLCASEAAYNSLANKDSGTLYLIPET